MNFSSYSNFRVAVQQLIDGDDISQSDLSVEVLDLLIAMGERRIYREVRSSTQDTAFSLTTTNNLVTLPSDFIELKGPPFVATFQVCEYVAWEVIQNSINLLVNLNGTFPGSPIYFSYQNDQILFYPHQPDATVVTGQYYKKFADISLGVLNALFTRHPDLFVYAALAESGPFLGELTRLPIWKESYFNLLQGVNDEERRRYKGRGKLQTKVA